MTKLHEAVRGVEVKELMPMVTDYRRGHKTVDFIKGYNSLAQAEVVVSLDELLETLADIEHTRWSGWQEYLHSKCVKNQDGSLAISASYAQNLERLIKTPYSDLTEKEKESDRAEARKTITVIATAIESGAIISLKEAQ